MLRNPRYCSLLKFPELSIWRPSQCSIYIIFKLQTIIQKPFSIKGSGSFPALPLKSTAKRPFSAAETKAPWLHRQKSTVCLKSLYFRFCPLLWYLRRCVSSGGAVKSSYEVGDGKRGSGGEYARAIYRTVRNKQVTMDLGGL